MSLISARLSKSTAEYYLIENECDDREKKERDENDSLHDRPMSDVRQWVSRIHGWVGRHSLKLGERAFQMTAWNVLCVLHEIQMTNLFIMGWTFGWFWVNKFLKNFWGFITISSYECTMLLPSKLCGFEDAQYTNKSVSDQLLFYLHLTDCHRFGKRIIKYHTEENTEQTKSVI